MKNILIILLSALSLTAFAQDKKTVAVLDPICRDNSVNPFYQQMVRGAMESAVTASVEYEAYDRSAFDMIQKEQAFQRTGAVSDSQIKKMGEMAGVDYVLVSEVSAYEGYLSAIVKILNVTTGKYDKSIDDYMQLSPESVKGKCKEMASSLFGLVSSNAISNNQNPTNNERSNTNSQIKEQPKVQQDNSELNAVDISLSENKSSIILSDGTEVQMLWKNPSYTQECRKAGEKAFYAAVWKNATPVNKEVKKSGLKGREAQLKATEELIRICAKLANEAVLNCSGEK